MTKNEHYSKRLLVCLGKFWVLGRYDITRLRWENYVNKHSYGAPPCSVNQFRGPKSKTRIMEWLLLPIIPQASLYPNWTMVFYVLVVYSGAHSLQGAGLFQLQRGLCVCACCRIANFDVLYTYTVIQCTRKTKCMEELMYWKYIFCRRKWSQINNPRGTLFSDRPISWECRATMVNGIE